jgi:hypothetical protein
MFSILPYSFDKRGLSDPGPFPSSKRRDINKASKVEIKVQRMARF